MSRFQRTLAHPIFARWFAQVHPFFWPVLYWQMQRHFRWMNETGYMDLLVRIEWWGGITIVYRGDRTPDPCAYRPLPRTFRPLTDASWGTSLPACLDVTFDIEIQRTAFILPCASGGGGSRLWRETEGALTPTPNTS